MHQVSPLIYLFVSRCKRHHPIQCFISYGGRSVVPFTRVSHYGTLKSFTMRKMLLDRKNTYLICFLLRARLSTKFPAFQTCLDTVRTSWRNTQNFPNFPNCNLIRFLREVDPNELPESIDDIFDRLLNSLVGPIPSPQMLETQLRCNSMYG